MGKTKHRTISARPKANSLLDLALTKTGHRVPFDNVQIGDQDAFGKVGELMLALTAINMSNKVAVDQIDDKLEAFSQDDGSLHVYGSSTFASERLVRLAPGTWKLLTDAEMSDVLPTLGDPLNSPELLESMATVLSQAATTQQDSERELNHAMQGCTQLITVAAKDDAGLRFAAFVATDVPALRIRLDQWLASEEQFAILSRGPDAAKNWILTSKDESTLLGETLALAAAEVDELARCLMHAPSLPEPLRGRTETLWKTIVSAGGSGESTANRNSKPPVGAMRASERQFTSSFFAGVVTILDKSVKGIRGLNAFLDSQQELRVNRERSTKAWLDGPHPYLIHHTIREGTLTDGFIEAGDPHSVASSVGKLLRQAAFNGDSVSLAIEVNELVRNELHDAIVKAAADSFSEPVTMGVPSFQEKALSIPVRDGASLSRIQMADCSLVLAKLDRHSIEALRTTGLVGLMKELVESAEGLLGSCGCLTIEIGGYDDDPRELHDIPEVQLFVARVSSECPWWLHLLHSKHPWLNSSQWWLFALIDRNGPTEQLCNSGIATMRTHISTESAIYVSTCALHACAELYEASAEAWSIDRAKVSQMMDQVGASLNRFASSLVPDEVG
jgi:hypothetical protein